jgi:hypothetical protein
MIVRTIMDDTVLIPVGTAGEKFNGLITLNETALFLWQQLPHVQDEQQLADELLKEYEVDEDTARKDIGEFLHTLRDVGVLD